MKLKNFALTTVAVLVSTVMLSACNDKDTAKADAANNSATQAVASVTKDSTFEQKAAYAVGASVGGYIAHMQKEQSDIVGVLDKDLIVKGFLDALDEKNALDQKEITDILVELDNKVRESLEKVAAQKAQENLEAGKKFLEENAKKEGVKTTSSGLQYEVIQEGTGKSPSADDIVKVKYKGTTIDGTVFDESNEPYDFSLSGIIPGWTEGLQLMKEGGKYKLYVPSDLAYGETGAGNIILPNSVLIFEIELVKVESKADTNKDKAAK